jgi:DnaK suppressor protein
MDPPVLGTGAARTGEGSGMNLAPTGISGFQEVLERKQADLVRALRRLDDIAIQKSADQMDEIQYASERDLAIRNVDRDSALLRQVKASLQRIHDGGFGICIQCGEAISPKRPAAVPWAPRCIHCQNAADRERQESAESSGEPLVNAA